MNQTLEEYDYQEEDEWCEKDLLAYKASSDPDTMYYHQAMKEPDRPKFLQAIVYTDDTILLGPDKKEIDAVFKKLDATFNIEDQGELGDYLGIKIIRKPDGIMEWSQPKLTESILKDLGLVDVKTKNQPTTRNTPSLTTVVLRNHEGEPDHDESKSFNYRQVIGKLLYLEKSTRPEIACAVHQCARFCAKPKTKHAEALKGLEDIY